MTRRSPTTHDLLSRFSYRARQRSRGGACPARRPQFAATEENGGGYDVTGLFQTVFLLDNLAAGVHLGWLCALFHLRP
jgi:hypothetical protein